MAFKAVVLLVVPALATKLGSQGWWPFTSGEPELPKDVQALVGSQDEALPLKAVKSAAPPRAMRAPTASPTAPALLSLAHAQPSPAEEYDEAQPGTYDLNKGVISALLGSKMTEAAPARVAAAAPTAPVALLAKAAGKPDPSKQCLDFATWAKEAKVAGKELTKLLMTSTCADKSAPQKYQEMCRDLRSDLQELEKSKDWIPAHACAILLTRLQKSGVGSNPLED
mmetsp:Transcript_101955/g.243061  ORF Transcript_101955/g.243061 Transcript_101955/m.243061 type:complete len:225 (+) Transcript_101955:39-713(+)